MNYKKAFYGFVRTLFTTSLIVVAVSILLFSSILSEYYLPVFPYLLVLFFVVALTVYHFMLKALEKRPTWFVNIFLLTTMLKLLVYMIFMLVYALLNREEARPFIAAFFVLYVIYTVVEVVSLLKVNRLVGDHNERSKPQ
jgi:hypothetical protein